MLLLQFLHLAHGLAIVSGGCLWPALPHPLLFLLNTAVELLQTKGVLQMTLSPIHRLLKVSHPTVKGDKIAYGEAVNLSKDVLSCCAVEEQ